MMPSHEASNDLVQYQGGCHCGRVRWTLRAPHSPDIYSCNCSICDKAGFLHLFVGTKDFVLDSGKDDLTVYRFNTGAAKHLFCRFCGVKSFYVPRSHPDGYSINARCLDRGVWREWRLSPFDGQNWETAVTDLRKE